MVVSLRLFPAYLLIIFSKIGKTSFGILLLMASLFSGCGTYQPVKKIDFFVRDGVDHQPLCNAHVVISDHGRVLKDLTTDALGHASMKVKELKIDPHDLDKYTLEWSAELTENGRSHLVKDQVPLNTYLKIYDLYLVNTQVHPRGTTALNVGPTADMHYHISMRTHNYFGSWIYPLEKNNHHPGNLDWYKSYKNLKILVPGEEGGHSMKKMPDHFMHDVNMFTLKNLQNQINAYDKQGSNKLTQFTQATFPHLLEGNVQLAYDAISPFERATSKTWRNRLAGNLFVTGARPKWMKRIGQACHNQYHMTHWNNFNLEYHMITQQDKAYNNFHWQFLSKKDTLQIGKPSVVLVVEGSHILQDKLFPNFINYNMGNRNLRNNIEILETIIKNKFPKGSMAPASLENARIAFIQSNIAQDPIENGMKMRWIDDNDPYTNNLDCLRPSSLNAFIQKNLDEELIKNIDSLKRLDPPICMIAISHLAYNGMTGHSVAWDQGGMINNLVARRNYGIRVSEEPHYRNQWEGAFFSVPGVNHFGRLVMDSLISKTNGHRILIDLKHSAPSTRQFFLDSIMIPRITCEKNDTLFPICSHCGVNGFPAMYSSPFVNEYNITRAPFVHNLYPFAINLYDEEIFQICHYDGIIGIPLEQRILGSYINKIETRSPRIKISGKMVKGKSQQIKRWNYVKRYLRYLNKTDPSLMEDANCYSKKMLGEPDCHSSPSSILTDNVVMVTYKDYKSAEPFLNNVFHVIDHSGKHYYDAWKHICIGSDLDGLVDPIDICPTASQYPKFKERLKQFIQIFLKLRQLMNQDPTIHFRELDDYFNSSFTIDDALDQLFFQSLFDFTKKRMLK